MGILIQILISPCLPKQQEHPQQDFQWSLCCCISGFMLFMKKKKLNPICIFCKYFKLICNELPQQQNKEEVSFTFNYLLRIFTAEKKLKNNKKKTLLNLTFSPYYKLRLWQKNKILYVKFSYQNYKGWNTSGSTTSSDTYQKYYTRT